MVTLEDVRVAPDEAVVAVGKAQPGLKLNLLPQQALAGGIRADDDAAPLPPPQDTTVEEDTYETNKKKVTLYFLETDAVFRRLSELRRKGWESKEGDAFFKNQRHNADKAGPMGVMKMNNMMGRIADEMQQATGAFSITNPSSERPMILDMCCAPGTYLQYALQANPGAGALGFSLPYEQGGHRLIVRTSEAVTIKLLDITLLAADMGMGMGASAVPRSDIPPDHPHARDLQTTRQIPPCAAFDLVLCDGQVLRTQQAYRAEYRERREARRLALTQLALGLEHLAPGGTMVVLLHRLEGWDTVLTLRAFLGFSSSVRLFKPRGGHAKRSSFYMVARGVRSRQAEAVAAVGRWKEDWRAATFETDDQRWREVRPHVGAEIPDVDAFLREFGPELAEMGREVWEIQADALERAPFMGRG